MFGLKKREEEVTELGSVDVWIVKWISMNLDKSYGSDGMRWLATQKYEYKAFTSKDSASLFKKELEAAFKLTGCHSFTIDTYKQEDSTNI